MKWGAHGVALDDVGSSGVTTGCHWMPLDEVGCHCVALGCPWGAIG